MLVDEIQYMETYVNEDGEQVLIAGDWNGRFYTGTRRAFDASSDEPSRIAFYDKQGVVQHLKQGGNIVRKSDIPWHNEGYHPMVNDPDRIIN